MNLSLSLLADQITLNWEHLQMFGHKLNKYE